jgi:hypothetical protein
VTGTKKPPAATGGESQSPTIRKKSDMSNDTATLPETTRTCPFTWCSGHDDWVTGLPHADPERIHVFSDEITVDADRGVPSPGVLPQVHACIFVTETRTTAGVVYSAPTIRLEATAADMGPASAQALAHGLSALAAALEAIDCEVAALS